MRHGDLYFIARTNLVHGGDFRSDSILLAYDQLEAGYGSHAELRRVSISLMAND